MLSVVDDATLLAILTRRAAAPLVAAAEAGEVLTTGSWYYRLHRALHDRASSGSLSRMAANLPAAAKDSLFLVINDLPAPRSSFPVPACSFLLWAPYGCAGGSTT
ncbi:MAG: hypothetical protein ABSD78_16855 [Acidimicrobiales bacterium]